MGDRILHLKEVYEDTKDGKYLEALQQDCAKLLPRASAIFKKIEKVHLSLITPSAGDEHEAVLLAIAKSLHEFQKDYDELLMWYGRLHPKHAKRTKKLERRCRGVDMLGIVLSNIRLNSITF